jgi:hypothetical protein
MIFQTLKHFVSDAIIVTMLVLGKKIVKLIKVSCRSFSMRHNGLQLGEEAETDANLEHEC